jgi:hypothetical protein
MSLSTESRRHRITLPPHVLPPDPSTLNRTSVRFGCVDTRFGRRQVIAARYSRRRVIVARSSRRQAVAI